MVRVENKILAQQQERDRRATAMEQSARSRTDLSEGSAGLQKLCLQCGQFDGIFVWIRIVAVGGVESVHSLRYLTHGVI